MNKSLEELEANLNGELCSIISNNRTIDGLFADLLENVRGIYSMDGYDNLKLSTVLMLDYVYHELIESSQIAQLFKDMIRAIVIYHISRIADRKDQTNDNSYIESDNQANFDID